MSCLNLQIVLSHRNIGDTGIGMDCALMKHTAQWPYAYLNSIGRNNINFSINYFSGGGISTKLNNIDKTVCLLGVF
ncbi:hypothetical protein XELAEV_18042074mg [Xenopus laevis]|uniref:Uncharacterized protein n=1 Tax=Xenopus laevis TaxID=8355 RepID=A0A974H5Q3_XENLA|nr:hypothetical protein XELAEV_18042074mg [Xenopus laevis]